MKHWRSKVIKGAKKFDAARKDIDPADGNATASAVQNLNRANQHAARPRQERAAGRQDQRNADAARQRAQVAYNDSAELTRRNAERRRQKRESGD